MEKVGGARFRPAKSLGLDLVLFRESGWTVLASGGEES
jgi:hypothetical protein